jgi:predicted Zn-dependent peptidase
VARQAEAELESLADQPEVRTGWAFLEQLYAPHPRSRPSRGAFASLAGLTAVRLRRLPRGALARADSGSAAGPGLTLAVTGDLDEEAVRRHLEGLAVPGGAAGADQEAREGAPAIPAPEGLPERRLEVPLPPATRRTSTPAASPSAVATRTATPWRSWAWSWAPARA